MANKRRKKPNNVLKVKFRKIWRNYRRWVFIICLLALLAWAVNPIKDRIELQKRNSEYQRKIDKLDKENETLKKDISRLKTDDYVEQLARKNLGLAKPDEEIYVVYEAAEKKPAPSTAPETKKTEEKTNLWDRVLRLLGIR